MEQLKDIILELETTLVNQDTRLSAEKLNLLLADDFIEYGSSGGIYDKKITIESLTAGDGMIYKIYDFEIVQLSEDLIQSRFKTDRTNPDGSNLSSLRSSIWKNNNGNWQMWFHQGTPIK